MSGDLLSAGHGAAGLIYHALRLYGADAVSLEFKRPLSNWTKQFLYH